MSDRLSLFCWLKQSHPAARLAGWEKLAELFPYSKLSMRESVFRVYAVDFTEPVVFERSYPGPFAPRVIMQAAREFHASDSAFQLECYWDLIQLDEDWQMLPAAADLWMFGPEFDNETSDHLRIDFGLEDKFLPHVGDDASLRASQANLRSLMRLAGEVSSRLPVERKHLWSESGTNFAEKLERIVSGGGSGLAVQ